MTTRQILAQVWELVGRGMTPLAIAQSMAIRVDEVEQLINSIKVS